MWHLIDGVYIYDRDNSSGETMRNSEITSVNVHSRTYSSFDAEFLNRNVVLGSAVQTEAKIERCMPSTFSNPKPLYSIAEIILGHLEPQGKGWTRAGFTNTELVFTAQFKMRAISTSYQRDLAEIAVGKLSSNESRWEIQSYDYRELCSTEISAFDMSLPLPQSLLLPLFYFS